VVKLSQLLRQIADKTLKKDELYKKVENDFSLVPVLLDGISSPRPTVKYNCGKVLMDLSAKYPQNLYPYMDEFIKLLESKYRILTWNAIFIIANLAKVDSKKKIASIFDRYFRLLENDYMITVANVVINSGKIALAQPFLIDRVTRELLSVEDIDITPHLTEECKRVIIEKTIQTFSLFFDKLEEELKVEIYDFVKRQLNSPRDTLRKKAELFLDKWK
jgi:hypothetical protein